MVQGHGYNKEKCKKLQQHDNKDINRRRDMNIRLVRPQIEHKSKALAFRQEFFDAGEHVINGSELLDQTDDYEEWLRSVTDNTHKETVNPNWVVTDTFFAFFSSDVNSFLFSSILANS